VSGYHTARAVEITIKVQIPSIAALHSMQQCTEVFGCMKISFIKNELVMDRHFMTYEEM
jgi:hypothetical protein